MFQPYATYLSPMIVQLKWLWYVCYCKCFLLLCTLALALAQPFGGTSLRPSVLSFLLFLSLPVSVVLFIHMFQTPVCVKCSLMYGPDRFTYLHFRLHIISRLGSFHFLTLFLLLFITYYYYNFFSPLLSFFPLIYFPFLCFSSYCVYVCS